MPEKTYPFCYLKDKFLSRIYQEGTGNEGVGFEVEHLDEHSRPGLAHNPSSGSTTRSPQFYFGFRLLMLPFTLSSPPSDSESPHKLFPAKLTLSPLINQSEFPQPVIPLFFYPIPQANTKPSKSLLNLENRHEINSGNIGGPLFEDDVTIMLELLYGHDNLHPSAKLQLTPFTYSDVPFEAMVCLKEGAGDEATDCQTIGGMNSYPFFSPP